MRHLKTGRALGIKPAHRRAMLRNMVTSLLEYQRIKTTLAKAKELRRPLDKMITLGKKGDLNSRRKALTYVKSKKAMLHLFGEFAERYADRPGGFSRIIRLPPRRGDGAEMALVVLVGAPNDPFTLEIKPKGGKKTKGKKDGKEISKGEKDKVKDKKVGKIEKVAAKKTKSKKADKDEKSAKAEKAAEDKKAEKPKPKKVKEAKTAETPVKKATKKPEKKSEDKSEKHEKEKAQTKGETKPKGKGE